MADDRRWMFRLAEPDTVKSWPIPDPIARQLIGERVEILLPGTTLDIETRLQWLIGRPSCTGTIVGRVANGEFWFAVRHNGPDGQVVLPRVVEGRLASRSPGSVNLDIREALSWTGLTLFAFGTLMAVILASLFVLDRVGLKNFSYGQGLASWILGSTATVVLLAVGWELADLVRGKNSGLREMVLAELVSKAEPGAVTDFGPTPID